MLIQGPEGNLLLQELVCTTVLAAKGRAWLSCSLGLDWEGPG
jgi:hypothetical protein